MGNDENVPVSEWRSVALVAVVLCLGWGIQFAFGDAATQPGLTIDVSAPIAAPISGHLKMGGKNPDGVEINANSRYLTLGGKPWMPVMGEIHYVRVPNAEWEDEILKMKAGGINVVSMYCIWIYHEEVEGKFDWTGDRDLRRFVQLCAKHGLYVYARIGPWCHGEVRNGGFPDWLPAKFKRTRRDDSSLTYTRGWYSALAAQLKGLLYKDGGPVIGIQLDNETGNQPAYLESLKKLAVEVGFDVPLYSYTGWNHSRGPADEMIPFYGGYPDGFWLTDNGISRSGRRQYVFTHILDDANITEHLTGRPGSITLTSESRYPYVTCEIGGGMAISYARRLTISADDVAALPLVKMGSGANGLGYYMYHGGGDLIGEKSTLQESQATGYPNDLPEINYDFQAPIGQFGEIRESYHALRALHSFVKDFGPDLAPMGSFFPDAMPGSLADDATLRWAVRSDGHRGFIFINNYERGAVMPEHAGTQFMLKLAEGVQAVPPEPVDIPSGAYMIWPVNLDMNGTVLKSSTAQLLCRLDGKMPTFVFFEIPGVKAEFELGSEGLHAISAPGSFVVKSADGREARVMLITGEQAMHCWKANLWGEDRLLFSRAELIVDGQKVRLEATDPKDLRLGIFPPPATPPVADGRILAESNDGTMAIYSADVAAKHGSIIVGKSKSAGPARELKMGSAHKPVPPDDADFASAAIYQVRVPEDALKGVEDFRIRIDYTGDVARAYIGNRLIDDDFYSGHPWVIGLKRFGPEVLDKGLTLAILPMPKGSPIFIQDDPPPEGVATLNGVGAEIVYEVEIGHL
jgi:beta-galactosidase